MKLSMVALSVMLAIGYDVSDHEYGYLRGINYERN